MTHVYDAEANELIEKVAEKLKKIDSIKAPEWAGYVKTGSNKERPPTNPDWWHIRAAAILRSIYKLGPVGTNKLRTKYGSKKRLGHKPSHFRKSSGSIIRKILQQLEKAELLKKQEKGVHKGRIIAPKGVSLLDKTAMEITKPRAAKKKEAVKEEKKEVKKVEEKKSETPKEEKKNVPKEESKKEKAAEKAK